MPEEYLDTPTAMAYCCFACYVVQQYEYSNAAYMQDPNLQEDSVICKKGGPTEKTWILFYLFIITSVNIEKCNFCMGVWSLLAVGQFGTLYISSSLEKVKKK